MPQMRLGREAVLWVFYGTLVNLDAFLAIWGKNRLSLIEEERIKTQTPFVALTLAVSFSILRYHTTFSILC